ncbi:hypothetical protein VTN96DRAFT_1758 [Rasamsonia emersonii]
MTVGEQRAYSSPNCTKLLGQMTGSRVAHGCAGLVMPQGDQRVHPVAVVETDEAVAARGASHSHDSGDSHDDRMQD